MRHPAVAPALLIPGEPVTDSVRYAALLSPEVTVIYAAGVDGPALAAHDHPPCRPPLYAPVTGTGSGGLATVMERTLGLSGTAVVRGDADDRGRSIWITLPL